jgi:hypothetical protein
MKKFIFLLIIFTSSLLAAEDIFTAKVYLQNTNREEFLFYHYNEIIRDGEKEYLRHYYLLPDSSIATLDEVVLVNDQFKSSRAEFFEVNEVGSVIRNNRSMILRFEKDGEVSEKEKDYPEDLLVGPLFNDHIKENWQALTSGEKIYFKLPAPDIHQVATFTFRKVENTEYENEGDIVLKLNVASIFLKLLVKPSYFVYEISTRRLKSIHGMTILRTKQDGKWQQSTNVDIYYNY